MPSTKKTVVKKRRGPAPKGEYADKAATLSTRITRDLRDWLEQAAKKTGRSLSDEIENRLRQTFVEEGRMIDRFGNERTARVLQVVANVLTGMRNPENPDADWLDDPITFDMGTEAIHWTLEAVRPKHQQSDWYELERIKRFDGEDKMTPATIARLCHEVWREIADAERALPLRKQGRFKQDLASIIKNKIPEIVERGGTIAPDSTLAVVTDADEPETANFTVNQIEANNELRRNNYFCIYCDEFYPKAGGSQCPECKGLDLSGHKHGGDGRQVKLLSPDEPGDFFTLLPKPRHPNREK
jgi:hypothetical protein